MRSLTRSSDTHSDAVLNHHLSRSKIRMINENIGKLSSFMKPRGNPFQITEEGVKLKNMVTQYDLYVSDDC